MILSNDTLRCNRFLYVMKFKYVDSKLTPTRNIPSYLSISDHTATVTVFHINPHRRSATSHNSCLLFMKLCGRGSWDINDRLGLMAAMWMSTLWKQYICLQNWSCCCRYISEFNFSNKTYYFKGHSNRLLKVPHKKNVLLVCIPPTLHHRSQHLKIKNVIKCEINKRGLKNQQVQGGLR